MFQWLESKDNIKNDIKNKQIAELTIYFKGPSSYYLSNSEFFTYQMDDDDLLDNIAKELITWFNEEPYPKFKFSYKNGTLYLNKDDILRIKIEEK